MTLGDRCEAILSLIDTVLGSDDVAGCDRQGRPLASVAIADNRHSAAFTPNDRGER
jgi:hypothetical protein